MDISMISGAVMQWLRSGLFWIILLAVFVLGTFIILIIRKRRKLIYPTFELTEIGAGKMGIKEHKSGWFNKKKMFFGLFDYGGEQALQLDDGREVQQASSEDFQDIRGQRGLIVYRKGDDPKILVPVSKVKVDGKELVLAIAPADYRDASNKIVDQAVQETMSGMNKIMQLVFPLILMIALLIGVIIVAQMVNHVSDKMAEVAAKECSKLANTVASNAP